MLEFIKHYAGGEINRTVAKNLAREVIESFGYQEKKRYIPVIKMANLLGFRTFVSALDSTAGKLFLNGKSQDIFGSDKAIVVRKGDTLEYNRYVIASLLAYYLFCLIQNSDFTQQSVVVRFNDDSSSVRAFVSELLTPSEVFWGQYRVAEDYDGRWLFTILYLAKFFKAPYFLVERRVTGLY